MQRCSVVTCGRISRTLFGGETAFALRDSGRGRVPAIAHPILSIAHRLGVSKRNPYRRELRQSFWSLMGPCDCEISGATVVSPTLASSSTGDRDGAPVSACVIIERVWLASRFS